jgi:hypothetical protein
VKEKATRAMFYWMNDNHTFIRLRGKNLNEIVQDAEVCKRNDPWGALCPVIVLVDKKELRRVGVMCHAQGETTSKWDKELTKWKSAVTKDPEILKLLDKGNIV